MAVHLGRLSHEEVGAWDVTVGEIDCFSRIEFEL